MALNAPAPANQNAPPVPVMLAAPKDGERLRQAAAAGEHASLVIDGRLEPDAEARNVVGRLERGGKLVVVSTPQSGWFSCAGERGPGIALFLGLAQRAAAAGSGPSWLFVSTSGHELGYMGMEHFMETAAPRAEDVLCWIHFGASIATRAWRRTPAGPEPQDGPPETGDLREHLVASPDLVPILERTFAAVPGITPRAGGALGELKNALDAGYRSLGFFGGHYFFHSPLDTPKTTSPELLAPFGRALAATVDQIEAGRA